MILGSVIVTTVSHDGIGIWELNRVLLVAVGVAVCIVYS